MLRRKPTAITLTTEDVAIYEDARAREALMREQALQAQVAAQQQQDASQQRNQNFRDPGARAVQVKTREERLGIQGGRARN
jgi:hypothetical protein